MLILSLAVWASVCIAKHSPRPLVLWHGLGDSAKSAGMLECVEDIQDIHPGIFVHSIYMSEDQDEDRKAGFYGNINAQIAIAATQLAEIPELNDGFDAIGLSQGGQFLRAYTERFNSPPVHNLITFGSQHMGISDIPTCRPYDFLCQVARRATKSAVYGTWAQANLIQAQYFRDPSNLQTYYKANHFLTDINNELGGDGPKTYAKNFASLNALVLLMFTEDKTVVPKESAWFGSEAPPTDEEDVHAQAPGSQVRLRARIQPAPTIIPMHNQTLYVKDTIGLRALDERGAVVFGLCEGAHMQMSDCWEDIVRLWVGGKV